MNRFQIAFSFITQLDLRHVLPTLL
jgi:hypothetical protein